MIDFPNAKINLGLNILSRRADGYHNLQTIFYPIALKDALEVIPSDTAGIQFTSSGLPISGSADNNLCVKAYHLIKKDFPEIGSLKAHLHKAIPMGAGMGGGSADGAFMLKLLNRLFDLKLSDDELMQYALALGSDCPFFIYNQPCLASSRGELLEPIKVDLSGFQMLIINPGIHINTAAAFAGISPGMNATDLREIIAGPVDSWKGQLVNDFEPYAFSRHPELPAIKETLYAQGAVYSAMTGSGSSLYGIFPAGLAPVLNFPSHYFCQWV
ncbi:MAG: 4-(cytidine 5'-diphospho)-2-C-methyl-D-erythritol kinase [Chitinophagaceae bacterium]|nr:MAG: 4-(cytidine 5'-diphospho)-2-C-methyl-D-erythritol kinase [Chitinophagaceae bacterium]